jgi:hypothetical protein
MPLQWRIQGVVCWVRSNPPDPYITLGVLTYFVSALIRKLADFFVIFLTATLVTIEKGVANPKVGMVNETFQRISRAQQ